VDRLVIFTARHPAPGLSQRQQRLPVVLPLLLALDPLGLAEGGDLLGDVPRLPIEPVRVRRVGVLLSAPDGQVVRRLHLLPAETAVDVVQAGKGLPLVCLHQLGRPRPILPLHVAVARRLSQRLPQRLLAIGPIHQVRLLFRRGHLEDGRQLRQGRLEPRRGVGGDFRGLDDVPRRRLDEPGRRGRPRPPGDRPQDQVLGAPQALVLQEPRVIHDLRDGQVLLAQYLGQSHPFHELEPFGGELGQDQLRHRPAGIGNAHVAVDGEVHDGHPGLTGLLDQFLQLRPRRRVLLLAQGVSEELNRAVRVIPGHGIQALLAELQEPLMASQLRLTVGLLFPLIGRACLGGGQQVGQFPSGGRVVVILDAAPGQQTGLLIVPGGDEVADLRDGEGGGLLVGELAVVLRLGRLLGGRGDARRGDGGGRRRERLGRPGGLRWRQAANPFVDEHHAGRPGDKDQHRDQNSTPHGRALIRDWCHGACPWTGSTDNGHSKRPAGSVRMTSGIVRRRKAQAARRAGTGSQGRSRSLALEGDPLMAKSIAKKPLRSVLFLCGSPRPKGNTNTVVEWARQGVAAAGATAEAVDLAPLKFKVNGCVCCMGCQKSEKYECVVRDDAQPILARMPRYDALVFATPVYFFGPTAQLKLVLDRMYSLFKFEQPGPGFGCAFRHATLGLISTAGDGLDGGLGAVADSFGILSRFTGCKLETLLVPNAPKDPRDLDGNAELRQKAMAFGRKLAGG
jgi:NAD(P)H-dependent FMN reductase